MFIVFLRAIWSGVSGAGATARRRTCCGSLERHCVRSMAKDPDKFVLLFTFPHCCGSHGTLLFGAVNVSVFCLIPCTPLAAAMPLTPDIGMLACIALVPATGFITCPGYAGCVHTPFGAIMVTETLFTSPDSNCVPCPGLVLAWSTAGGAPLEVP